MYTLDVIPNNATAKLKKSITFTTKLYKDGKPAVPFVGVQYQWRVDGVDIPGATLNTFTATYDVECSHNFNVRLIMTDPINHIDYKVTDVNDAVGSWTKKPAK